MDVKEYQKKKEERMVHMERYGNEQDPIKIAKEKKHKQQKVYYQKPEIKARTKEYQKKNKEKITKQRKEYDSRPEVIARRKAYKQKPEVKERMKEYNSRPEVKERMKEYNSRPEVIARRKKYTTKYSFENQLKKYGLTTKYYYRMLKQQGGVCAICGNNETIKQNGKVINLAVDHCHKTGKVRGLLCGRCNLTLGILKEDISLLYNYVEYLKQHSN